VSCYEWEHGEVTLPRSAVVPLRRAIIARNNQIADAGLALAKKVWSEATAKQKRDPRYLGDAVLQAGGDRRYDRFQGRSFYADTAATGRAQQILDVEYFNSKPRPPQKQNAGHLGATATEFHVSGLSVSFDTKTGKMDWDVGENNHAVDAAHETWLAETVFEELGKIRWTRGTGGWFTGNDEYNRDDSGPGGGGNYVTSAFGPVGMEHHPSHTQPFTKSDRTRVTSEMLTEAQRKLYAREARAQAAYARALSGSSRRKTTVASTAGSFAPHARSTPDIRLR